MFIVCGRGNLAAAFYLDKKCSNVQVGAKLAVSPPDIFISRMLKNQAVDLGLGFIESFYPIPAIKGLAVGTEGIVVNKSMDCGISCC